jgi:hypothetical protein
MQDTSGVRVWLVPGKAFRALAAHAEDALKLTQSGLGDSESRVLEVLPRPGSVTGQHGGPQSVAHAEISACLAALLRELFRL